MFDRKLITVMLLSFVTMLGFNLIFRDRTPTPSGTVQLSEQVVSHANAYKLPTQHDLMQPANREIAVINQPENEVVTSVDMPNYQATFTSVGGTIQSLRYPAHTDKNDKPLQAIHAAEHRELTPFLVALNNDAPLNYTIKSQNRTDNGTQVQYEARSADWRISKVFFLHADSYRIDLTIGFTPLSRNAAAVRPRLLVPAPAQPDLKKDAISGVVTTDNKKGLQQVTGAKALDQAWVTPTLFGAQNSYFAHVLLDDARTFAQRGYFKQEADGSMTAIYEGPELTDEVNFPLSFYVGPKAMNDLKAVDERLVDLLSFGWLSWFAKLLLQLLQFIYQYVGNYGLAIIVMTILLKLLLMPFSLKSAGYMAQQQKLQPRMAGLRKKYGHDQQLLHAKMMELYAQHGVSPMGSALGCLLALPQFPIFFALYRVLGGAIELHQTSFLWITDLSLKDPYYILPLAVGVMTFLQPFGMQQSDSRAAVMSYLMPLILIAVFVGLPAGLLLFIFTNFAFTLGEQKLRKVLAG